jgi:hypothetical protein
MSTAKVEKKPKPTIAQLTAENAQLTADLLDMSSIAKTVIQQNDELRAQIEFLKRSCGAFNSARERTQAQVDVLKSILCDVAGA